MFDIRSKEEADGERRMIGSGLLVGALGLCDNVLFVADFSAAACAAFLALNGAASLRTCEKSCILSKFFVLPRGSDKKVEFDER